MFPKITPIPIFDSFAAPLLIFLFLILLAAQHRNRLRSRVFNTLKHTLINIAVAFPASMIFRLAILPVGLIAAEWSQNHNFGLLWRFPFPVWIRYVISFLLMDCTFYYWHVFNHRVPFLWRFHNVHHIDLDLDVSTASRFHYGEMIFSVGFRALQIAVLGIPASLFLIYEILFQVATEFHHSNWKLPYGLERKLVKLIVTPRMHGIHHSIVQQETDSNFSVIFSFWDRIHRTIRLNIPQNEITIGVPGYLNPSYQKIFVLWLLPFRKQKEYWVNEDGTQPAREKMAEMDVSVLAF